MVFDVEMIGQDVALKGKAETFDTSDRKPDAEQEAYRGCLVQMDSCAAKIPSEMPTENAAAERRRYERGYAFQNVMQPLAHRGKNGAIPATLYYLVHDETADEILDEMREVVAKRVWFRRSDTRPTGNMSKHTPNPDLMFVDF